MITLDDRADWEASLCDLPHAFSHTWNYCSILAEGTGDQIDLYRYQEPGLRIVSVIAQRRMNGYVDVVTPLGFPGFVGTSDYVGFEDVWRQYAVERGFVCGYIVLNPVLTSDSYFHRSATRHRTVFVFDLNLSENELFRRLSTNRKRQLRAAARQGGKIILDRERLAPFFVATYPRFMARRAAGRVYGLEGESLDALCRAAEVIAIGVEVDGRIEAVSLFGYTAHFGDFLYNVSLPGGERHSVRLIWEGMRSLKDRGVPFLNLGGGVTENDSLAEFKRRFGAQALPLRHVRDVYRPEVYQELSLRAGVDPDSSAEYFPAYRAGRK